MHLTHVSHKRESSYRHYLKSQPLCLEVGQELNSNQERDICFSQGLLPPQKPSLFSFSDPWKGVLWKIAACGCFALLNVIVRFLTRKTGGHSQPLSPYEITFIQDVFGCLLMLPWFIQRMGLSLKIRSLWLHTVRILFSVTGVIVVYFAFAHMEVTKAVALGMTDPVFSVLGAWIFLKERIHVWRWCGIGLGFIGIWMIARPDLAFSGTPVEDFSWIILLPLISAACFSISKLCGRTLAKRGESPEVLAGMLLLFLAPGALAAYGFFALFPGSWLPEVSPWVLPTWDQWFLLFMLGVAASSAHYAMAKSYVLADLSFVTPFGSTRLLFSALLSYLFFSELSTAGALWIGALLIILSTICLALDRSPLFQISKK